MRYSPILQIQTDHELILHPVQFNILLLNQSLDLNWPHWPWLECTTNPISNLEPHHTLHSSLALLTRTSLTICPSCLLSPFFVKVSRRCRYLSVSSRRLSEPSPVVPLLVPPSSGCLPFHVEGDPASALPGDCLAFYSQLAALLRKGGEVATPASGTLTSRKVGDAWSKVLELGCSMLGWKVGDCGDGPATHLMVLIMLLLDVVNSHSCELFLPVFMWILSIRWCKSVGSGEE